MRLVLDARFWRRETGGIGRYSRELVHGLLALGTDDEFHLILTPPDAAQFAVTDKRVVPHVVAIGHYSVAEQTQLPRLLREIQPDLTHFLNFNQPLFSVGRRVTTIHDLTVKYFPVGRSQSNPLRRAAFTATMRQAATSHGVIAISRSTKADIIRDFALEPMAIRVIGEAAGTEFAPRSAREQAALRTQISGGQPYILFVNQWRPHKGLPELVQAFEQLKQQHRLPHKLIITGKPSPHFPHLTAAIERSPVRSDILTPGFVPDEALPGYYAAAAVLAFPSYYEGFGLGILEAMQAGTPVVCSDSSSLPEVAGDAALFVRPGDVAQLATALHRVSADSTLAAELSRRGRVQAAKFSWATTAKQTYDLYRSVAG